MVLPFLRNKVRDSELYPARPGLRESLGSHFLTSGMITFSIPLVKSVHTMRPKLGTGIFLNG